MNVSDSQNRDPAELEKTTSNFLRNYGLKVEAASFKVENGKLKGRIKALPENSGSELLFDTTAVSVLFQKLYGNLQAIAAVSGMDLADLILETPSFTVQNRQFSGVSGSLKQPIEGPVIFRKIGDLQFGQPLAKFIGAESIAAQWKPVLKANRVMTDEKKINCDIIVRQSGTAYCAFKDILVTLDGKKVFLNSGDKLLRMTDFQEVKEERSSSRINVLFSAPGMDFALLQAMDEGLLTLTRLSDGQLRVFNPYVVQRLNTLKKASMFLNEGVHWLVLEGETAQNQPLIEVLQLSEKGKTVIYECPSEQLETIGQIVDGKDKNNRSMKAWIARGGMIKLPESVDVERSK